MAPSEYIEARNQPNNHHHHNGHHHVKVDDRPYFPFLFVDKTSEESIKKVTTTVLFHDVNDNQLIVTRVTGGNTNSLFRVSGLKHVLHENSSNSNSSRMVMMDSVLIRVFGAAGIIDRDVETATYAALARQSFLPTYLGRFANGRIEGWLEGMRPLADRELSDGDISTAIAHEMAHLHAGFAIPPSLEDHHSDKITDNRGGPALWSQMGGWMDRALESYVVVVHNNHQKNFVDPMDFERAKELVPDFGKLPAELTWLRDQVIPKDDDATRCCFCHNDVLASNIMIMDSDDHGATTATTTTKKIQLIDFEYGGINYSAFDIANHFNEFAGGTIDGVPNYEWFPSPEFQRQFIQTYLEAHAKYSNSNNNSNNNNSTNEQQQQQQQPTATTTPAAVVSSMMVSDKDVTDFHQQVKAFVLVNHLYWGLWGVNQAATEGCTGFDYLRYGSLRIKQYYHCKNEIT